MQFLVFRFHAKHSLYQKSSSYADETVPEPWFKTPARYLAIVRSLSGVVHRSRNDYTVQLGAI